MKEVDPHWERQKQSTTSQGAGQWGRGGGTWVCPPGVSKLSR